jgi:hypothetical protein
MALIVKTLPGLYGGVSSQTESLRKDNQVTEMINCIPSLITGTTRRANVEQEVVTIPSASSFIYDYSRSTGESHVITVAKNGNISVHTIGVGNATITVDSAVKQYLAHTDSNSLSGITIGDTTYLNNSERTVGVEFKATADMSELDPIYKTSAGDVEVHAENIAYYWLSRSSNDPDHKYRYVVELNGDRYEYDSDKSDEAAMALSIGELPDGTAVNIKKNGTAIAGGINGQSGWTSEVLGSILKIHKDNFSSFTFNFWDSWGSLASFGWKYDVSKLQDLQSSFPWDGARVRVNASDGSNNTDYYAIRFNNTWQEFTNRCTYSGSTRKLPLLTNLPIVITRGSDGSFHARLLTTGDQLRPPLVGNDTNNKDPYFVNKKIQQLFYINGRLCIVSDDALTFSETDMLWNFYTTTVIDVWDSDTLEVKIASERVLEILKVAIFQSGLLIMTSEGQYIFNTEQGISPNTIAINKLSNYSYNNAGGTVYDGDSIVFSGTTGDTSRLYRYRVARLTSENKAIDLTIQVPTYIQGVIQQIVNYVEDGTLIVRSSNSKSLYIYKEVISGDQMVQSSWFTWDFSNILTNDISHIMVINDYLYFISGTHIYKIPLGTKIFSDSFEHLDLGTIPYESRIVLSRWRPKKTNAQIQTTRGRSQLRALGVALEGSAILEIFKEDRELIIEKVVRDKHPINVLSDTNKTVLSIINNGNNPFSISALTLSGTYREKGRETV